jgi:hypothetical protein
MGRKNDKQHEAAVAERRGRVSKFYLQGYPQRAVAEMVGCSQATVHRDIAEVMKGWREQAECDVKDRIARQLARIQLLRNHAWQVLDQTPGDHHWAALLIRLDEREAALMGTDRPKGFDLTGLQMSVTKVVSKEVIEALNA